jgi:hypothetical protein
MFRIECDPSRRLILATLRGFMSVAEVADFHRQEQKLVKSMDWRSGEYVLVVDTVEAVIQSKEVVEAFVGIADKSPYRAQRISVVRGSALTRIQTQRILRNRENSAVFQNIVDAKAWALDELSSRTPLVD